VYITNIESIMVMLLENHNDHYCYKNEEKHSFG